MKSRDDEGETRSSGGRLVKGCPGPGFLVGRIRLTALRLRCAESVPQSAGLKAESSSRRDVVSEAPLTALLPIRHHNRTEIQEESEALEGDP